MFLEKWVGIQKTYTYEKGNEWLCNSDVFLCKFLGDLKTNLRFLRLKLGSDYDE